MTISPDLIGAILGTLVALMVAVRLLLVRKVTLTGNVFDALVSGAVLGFLIFVPSALILHYPNFELSTISVCMFALGGVIGRIIGIGCHFKGTERVGASRASPIKNASLLVSTFIAIFILGEAISPIHLGGIFLLLVGIFIVSREISNSNTSSGRERFLDFLYPIGALTFIGLADPIIKAGFSEGTPIIVGIAIFSIASLISLVVYSIWNNITILRPFRSKESHLYIGIGILSNFTVILMFTALNLSRVVVVVPFKNLAPFFVLILSFLYMKHLEKVTKFLIIGTVLIFSGVVLVGAFM